MSKRVKYEAVLEYEEGDMPDNPEKVLFDLISRQPDFGSITVTEAED